MSAYLVGKDTIDLLVSAGLWAARDGCMPQACGHSLDTDAFTVIDDDGSRVMDLVGRMLWAENLASVAHRYPGDVSGDRPGPVGLTDADIYGYVTQLVAVDVEPGVIAAAVHCFEYQCCETSTWSSSPSADYCRAVSRWLLRALPGYGGAREWERVTGPVR